MLGPCLRGGLNFKGSRIPEQNRIIERFFRSLKEEYVWPHTFQTFEEARRIIWDWMQWYNQCSVVRTYVMSVAHLVLGAVGWKSRSR